MDVQERLADKIVCKPEDAKEALDAFRSVFVDMKIQHIFPAGDVLEFSFSRHTRHDDEHLVDGGKDDGKRRKEPERQAA